MESVTFETTDTLDVSELAEFYARHKHRPVVSADKLARMIQKSDCLITARRDGRLIGIARGLSDGVYGHLAECKLDPSCQGPAAVTRKDGRIEHDREGIACEMASRVIDALRELGVEEIHVLAYGTEVDFCEDLGFKKIGGTVALRMEVAADAPVEAVAQ